MDFWVFMFFLNLKTFLKRLPTATPVMFVNLLEYKSSFCFTSTLSNQASEACAR